MGEKQTGDGLWNLRGAWSCTLGRCLIVFVVESRGLVEILNGEGDFMHAIKAVYDGFTFTPTEPIPIQGQYEVIITFIEPIPNQGETVETNERKIKLGFLKDILPPLPDSFFDPLPRRNCNCGGCRLFVGYAHFSLGNAGRIQTKRFGEKSNLGESIYDSCFCCKRV